MERSIHIFMSTVFVIHFMPILSENCLETGKAWNDILTNLPPDQESLTLVHCTIFQINKEFNKLRRLKRLSLNHNGIYYISAGAFSSNPLTKLHLSGNMLPAVPEVTLPTLKNLDLSLNSIKNIPSLAFIGFPTLKKLDLRYNHITTIEENAFHGTQMKQLKLDSNKLVAFPPLSDIGKTLTALSLMSNSHIEITEADTQALNSLDHLNIANVGMTKIPSLESIKSSLKSLIMSINPLSAQPTHLFDGFQKLHTIVLSSANITELPSLLSVKRTLKTLILDENYISYVPEASFVGMMSLRRLSVSHNNLDTFPRISYLSLDQLDLRNNFIASVQKKRMQNSSVGELILSYNKLQGFPDPRASDACISVLRLHGNPLSCDCHMTWMKEAEHGDWMSVRLDDTPCITPTHLQNVHWKNVTEQRLSCGGSNTGIVAGIVSLILVLVIAIGLVIFFLKIRKYLHGPEKVKTPQPEGVDKGHCYVNIQDKGTPLYETIEMSNTNTKPTEGAGVQPGAQCQGCSDKYQDVPLIKPGCIPASTDTKKHIMNAPGESEHLYEDAECEKGHTHYATVDKPKLGNTQRQGKTTCVESDHLYEDTDCCCPNSPPDGCTSMRSTQGRPSREPEHVYEDAKCKNGVYPGPPGGAPSFMQGKACKQPAHVEKYEPRNKNNTPNIKTNHHGTGNGTMSKSNHGPEVPKYIYDKEAQTDVTLSNQSDVSKPQTADKTTSVYEPLSEPDSDYDVTMNGMDPYQSLKGTNI